MTKLRLLALFLAALFLCPQVTMVTKAEDSSAGAGIAGSHSAGEAGIAAPAADGQKLVAHNGGRYLYVDTGTGCFALTDGAGHMVTSNTTKDYYGTSLSAKLERNMSELATITYLSTADEEVSSFHNSDNDGTVKQEITLLENGFSAVIQKTDVDIGITVNVTLEEGYLYVRVPLSGAWESQAAHLVTVEILPFFGAANNQENGYVVYPDGSGAVYTLENKPNISRNKMDRMIYGDNLQGLDDFTEDLSQGTQTIMLPLFGIKKGNTALCGMVTTGESDVSLCFAPSGYIYQLSRVYPILHYRYSANYTTVTGEAALQFENASSSHDFEMCYALLTDDQADYSGMADTCRSWLLDHGKLNQCTVFPDISADLLMTVKKDMLLWKSTQVMTSFADAGNFLKKLNDLNYGQIRLDLLGWQGSGYNTYPSHASASFLAGGSGGLKKLTDLARSMDASVFLSDNYMEADQDVGGYSRRNDTAKNVLGQVITNADNSKYLLNISRQYSVFEEAVKKTKSSGIAGYSFELMGSLLYSNASSSGSYRRTQAVNIVQQYLSKSKQQFGSVSVSGGNAYGYAAADFISDLPENSSQDFLFDYDIPLIQMVLHGSIPYSSSLAGNFTEDLNKLQLTWLEYGYVPDVTLSQSPANLLKNTTCEDMEISAVSDWMDNLAVLSQSFLPTYQKIKGIAMVKHERLGDIRRITYQNGMVLLLNYGEKPTVVDGVEVPSVGFQLLRSR